MKSIIQIVTVFLLLSFSSSALPAQDLNKPRVFLASAQSLKTVMVETEITNLMANSYFQQHSGGQYYGADGVHLLVTKDGGAIAIGKWSTQRRAGQALLCETESTGYYQHEGSTILHRIDDTCFLVSVTQDQRVVLTTNQNTYLLGKPRRKGFEIQRKFNKLYRKFGL
jgi:hypothetical protein